MGSKLDQVHADITRIATALREDTRRRASESLLEAKKKKPKFKVGSGKKDRKARGETRQTGKQKKKQRQFYQGQSPVAKGQSFDAPFELPTVGMHAPAAPAPITPPSIVNSTPQPAKTPAAKSKTMVSTPTPKKAPEAPQQPEIASPRKRSFWDRIKQKVSGQRREAGIPEPEKTGIRSRVGGFLRKAKRRLLGSDVELPRTLIAARLVEQRSSTTFKACPKRAMVSTPGLRKSLPLNTFAKPDEKNPTFPIRSKCRASLAGVGRALQKDMSNAGEALTKQVLQRVNRMGGTRGKTKLKLWGTGKGGKRMETYRGKPHSPKRTKTLAKKLGISRKAASKLHGVSTGKADMVKHTSPYSPVGGSKGPAGNREVPRSSGSGASRKMSNRKKKRRESSRAVTIGRGKALAGVR